MIFVFLLVPFISIAHIVQDDVTTTDKKLYSYKDVCLKMVTHESPLIEVASSTEIDCMGKKISVGHFCDKELASDPYYLRAYIDKDLKQVVCHSGKKVLFKLQCVKRNEHKYCSSEPKKSCLQIREKLAKRLDVVHSSVTRNEKGIKELNCYFESLPMEEKSIGTL